MDSLTAALDLPVLVERINLMRCYTGDQGHVQALLAEVRRLSAVYQQESKGTGKARTITSKQVGDALEGLIHYAFKQTSGILSPLGPVNTPISQLDNVVEVRLIPNTFLADWHPIVLVECKNYGQPLSKKMVSDFVGEVQRSAAANCRVGIIVSRKGATANAERLIMQQVGQMQQNHRRYILVITDEDLDALAQGENLFEVLRRVWIRCCLSCV